MAEHTSSIGDSIRGLVVVYYIVDVLRVGLGERLTVVPAHPEIAVVGSLLAFNMCTELLANREGDNGVGNRDVGNTNAIDRIPLPICNRAMVQNNTVQPSDVALVSCRDLSSHDANSRRRSSLSIDSD
jgi:hypothetical protein